MKQFFILFLLPVFLLGQTDSITELLTSDTWNISYNITPDGERLEEESPNKIRGNWVKFNTDGTFETPGGISGKNIGKWEYIPEENAIHFSEKGGKYRAVINDISELVLELNYVDNGGFIIGLIHYVYIPKEKSAEDTEQLLTTGRWNIVQKRFDGIEDRTPQENLENTWYEFHSGGTYTMSEVIGDDIVTTEGFWFLDEKVQLNLDAGENTIYTVIGDKSRLILTTVSGGYNTIEMVKAKN